MASADRHWSGGAIGGPCIVEYVGGGPERDGGVMQGGFAKHHAEWEGWGQLVFLGG